MLGSHHGFIVLNLAMALCFLPLSAKTIVYERGGVTDSAGIVNKGVLHLELGAFSYEDYHDSNSHSYSIGSSLLRYGLIQDNLELRITGSGLNFTEQSFSYNSIGLALKNKIYQSENEYFPAINLINHFDIPLTNKSRRRFFYFNKFILSQKLSKNFSFLGNIGSQISNFEIASNEFISVELPWVASLGYSGLEHWVLFSQIYGQASYSNSVSSLFGWNLGCNYIVRDDLILDLTLFQGLNNATVDFGIDFGVSTRF